MKSNDLLAVLEKEVAPVALSAEFCKKCNFYDNSGILIDSGSELKGALFSLDLSPSAVEEAKRLGYNAIVTHHPAIYGGISNIIADGSPLASAITQCVRGGFTVISMHLNFDAAPEGIDYHLMRGLGGDRAERLIHLSDGGYGRVYNVEKTTLAEFAERIKSTFSTDRLLVYGDMNGSVETVASFCGAGCDDDTVAFAIGNHADVFVSSDMPHHRIADLVGRGMAVVVLTHYAAENYGFHQIYENIKNKLGIPSSHFADGKLL